MLVAVKAKNRIPDILTKQKRSIYWLAKQVEMSYQAIYALVNAAEIPDGTSYGTLAKISDALGVSIDELADRDEPSQDSNSEEFSQGDNAAG